MAAKSELAVLFKEDRPAGLAMNAGSVKSETNLAIINAYRASRNLAPVTMDQLTQSSGEKLLDLRLTKQFPLARTQRLDVFLEAYNVFNTTNYENPDGRITPGSFLVRTIARDPRQNSVGRAVRFLERLEARAA